MADVDKHGEGWLFAEDAVIGSLLIDEKAALAILEELAKNRQVILFTCQQREGNAANA